MIAAIPKASDWSILRELALDAGSNLYAMRQRAILALIGIAIGTAAVIAMLNIGENAQREAMRQFEAMGTDLLIVQNGPTTPASVVIAQQDVEAVRTAVPSIRLSASMISGGDRVLVGRSAIPIATVAAGPDLLAIAKLKVPEGRGVSPFDGFSPFAVIGAEVARQMRQAGTAASPGDTIRVGDTMLTIIGVLEPTIPNALLSVDFNAAVIVPLDAGRRLMRSPRISSVAMQMAAGSDDAVVATTVAQAFKDRLRGADLQVQSARQLIAAMQQQMQLYALMLLAIGGISLAVGGIGIMNVMLMSVVERRREIGVRLALGARRRDVRSMFLIEAIALSLMGGVIGTVLGVAAAFLFARYSGWPFTLSNLAVPLGAGTATLVGLFFGSYPAARAAQLDPIAALRSE